MLRPLFEPGLGSALIVTIFPLMVIFLPWMLRLRQPSCHEEPPVERKLGDFVGIPLWVLINFFFAFAVPAFWPTYTHLCLAVYLIIFLPLLLLIPLLIREKAAKADELEGKLTKITNEQAYCDRLATTLKAEGFSVVNVAPVNMHNWSCFHAGPPMRFNIVLRGDESLRAPAERLLDRGGPRNAYSLHFQADL
jgi:hypothetical protein